MSLVERCPRAEDLPILLDPTPDGEAAAGLRRHTGECPQCQSELLQLQEGFAALGPPPGWREPDKDALAQQRIAAVVVPEILAGLAGPAPARAPLPAGLAGPAPVRAPLPVARPVPRPAVGRAVGLGLLAALAGVPAALVWLRHGYTLHEPGRALALALLPAVVLPALGPAARRGVGSAALLGTLGLVVALALSSLDGMAVGFLAGSGCLLLAVSGCALPAALVLGAASRGGAAADAVSRALLGVALFSGGAALQRALCGVAGLPHSLVFHLGPFLLAVALFTVLFKRGARELAPDAAAT